MCMVGKFQEMRNVPKDKPIVAWRGWRQGDGGLLYSQETDTRWEPFEPLTADATVTTKNGSFDNPTRNNPVGIFAWRSKKRVAHKRVYGEVYLWGKVAIHAHGYRAQHACIKSVEYNPTGI